MKYSRSYICGCSDGSLPSRERGLKSVLGPGVPVGPESLPSRERGLKSGIDSLPVAFVPSLPSRERGLKFGHRLIVRHPRASLPSRERGLKSVRAWASGTRRRVAPFTGAWIEINSIMDGTNGLRSLPSRERGLKLVGVVCFPSFCLSLPSRERGLKSPCPA